MRLVLVDAEPRVTEGLTRMLFGLEPSWRVAQVRTTQEALSTLAEQPCDAVVSELRGPSLDGKALLSRVATLYPRTARFVLSSYDAEETAVDLLQTAHQLLPKPCAAETLHRVLKRLDDLSRLLPDRRLQGIAAQAGFLPSPPEVLQGLRDALQADADSAALGALFRVDPGATAKLMQLASSGFACGFGKIADIDAAHQQLGSRLMQQLAGSLSVGPPSPEAAPRLFTPMPAALRYNQARARHIATLASGLARLPEDAATAYVAGLLCDVGQLLLTQTAPERLYAMEAEASQRAVSPHVMELATWGATHAELGAYLLALWGLPFQIVETVANHHTPERAAADRLGLTQIVWLAACVVDGEEPSADTLSLFAAEELYRTAQQTFRAMLARGDSFGK